MKPRQDGMGLVAVRFVVAFLTIYVLIPIGTIAVIAHFVRKLR